MMELMIDSLEQICEPLHIMLPGLTAITSQAIPQPYRRLLDHHRDMTGTLEAWHHSRLHLNTLKVTHIPDGLHRWVLLVTENDHVVEMGAIHIYLEDFEGEARERILGCRQPLGNILTEFKIGFNCRLQGFYQLASDVAAEYVPDLPTGKSLYGRHNRLVFPDGRPIADVLELLPPASEG